MLTEISASQLISADSSYWWIRLAVRQKKQLPVGEHNGDKMKERHNVKEIYDNELISKMNEIIWKLQHYQI